MSREVILHDLYSLIGSRLPSSSYAMKGGYVLRSLLDEVSETRDIRYTEDIDVSIKGIEYFNSIVDAVLPYIQRLIINCTIYSYKIQEPNIETGRSGYIKLYRKATANTRAYVYCGIDVDIRALDYGIVTLNDGMSSYSIERMLADKFMALYFGDLKRILHRSKDIVDIYLLSIYLKAKKGILQLNILLRSIKSQLRRRCMSNIPTYSSLETIYCSSLNVLVDSVNMVKGSSRMNNDMIEASANEIIECVLNFINYIRSCLNEE